MKIISTKDNLAYAVQMVQRVVSLKSPMPILSGILFSAASDNLTVSATDMEMNIQCIVPVQVLEEGSIVLPSRYITEMVKRLPDVQIELETNAFSSATTIRYGNSEFSINGFPSEEFPAFPPLKGQYNFSLPEENFKEMLRQVLFATHTDETRPIFTGVLFELEGNEMRLVATDTHRLAFRRSNLENGVNDLINPIVPGKTLNEVSRIIGVSGRLLDVTLGDNQIMFSTGDTRLVSRLIAGKFPSYRQVIPNEHICRLQVNARDLLESSERAALIAKEGSPVVSLQVHEGGLVLSVHTTAGWIREQVKATIEGEAMEISFNARYLGDVLRVVGTEEIIMDLTGPLSPAIVRPLDHDDYLSLLLPARPYKE